MLASGLLRGLRWYKNPPAMQETGVQSLGQEGPLAEGMATHSRIPAWRIPWTEETEGLWFMESHSLKELSNTPPTHTHTCAHTRARAQPPTRAHTHTHIHRHQHPHPTHTPITHTHPPTQPHTHPHPPPTPMCTHTHSACAVCGCGCALNRIPGAPGWSSGQR